MRSRRAVATWRPNAQVLVRRRRPPQSPASSRPTGFQQSESGSTVLIGARKWSTASTRSRRALGNRPHGAEQGASLRRVSRSSERHLRRCDAPIIRADSDSAGRFRAAASCCLRCQRGDDRQRSAERHGSLHTPHAICCRSRSPAHEVTVQRKSRQPHVGNCATGHEDDRECTRVTAHSLAIRTAGLFRLQTGIGVQSTTTRDSASKSAESGAEIDQVGYAPTKGRREKPAGRTAARIATVARRRGRAGNSGRIRRPYTTS